MKNEVMPGEYYIRRIPSGFCGNSPFWWAKDGKGYTSYILNAERFTEKAAHKLVKEDPEKWEMYKCKDVDVRLHLIFDMQDKSRLGTDEPCSWGSGYAPHPNTRPTTPAQDEALKALHWLLDGSKNAFDALKEIREEVFAGKAITGRTQNLGAAAIAKLEHLKTYEKALRTYIEQGQKQQPSECNKNAENLTHEKDTLTNQENLNTSDFVKKGE